VGLNNFIFNSHINVIYVPTEIHDLFSVFGTFHKGSFEIVFDFLKNRFELFFLGQRINLNFNNIV
jgi:hypothetical protein